MNKIIVGSLVSVMTLAIATSASAGTLKLPQCLAFPTINGSIPCTGIVPVDTVNGNPITWSSLFANGTLGTVAPVTGNLVGAKDLNGDLQPLSVGANGGLNVNILTGGGSGNGSGATATVGQAPGSITNLTGYVGSDGHVYNWAGDTVGHPAVSIFGTPSVSVTGSVAVTGTFFQTTQPISGSVSVSNLPSTQTVAGTVNLGTLNGAALDTSVQAVKTTLGTPMQQTGGTISVVNFPSTQVVSGSISNTAFGAKLLDSTGVAFGTSGNPIFVSGTSGGSATPTGTAGAPNAAVLSVQGIAGGTAVPVSGSVSVSNLPTTQAVSAVSLPLPTGAATSANQTTAIASLATIATNTAAPIPAGTNAIGSITNTTFGATQSGTWNIGTVSSITNPVAVTGTFFQATQPVSLTALPALATGANVIGSISNTGFSATQSGTWNIANVTGTISLPTGAATATAQATQQSTLGSPTDVAATTTDATSTSMIAQLKQSVVKLATLNTTLGTPAQAAAQTTGNTSLATIATNTTSAATTTLQTAGNTSLATIVTNTTGLASSTNQTTGNTSLATIATNTTGVATAVKQPAIDTNGDLRVQTPTITQTSVTLTTGASTQLVPAMANRIAIEIQCDGTAPVGLDLLGGTITSVAAAPRIIPSASSTASYPLYTPPYATKTAITYMTATAQVCRVTQYAQQ